METKFTEFNPDEFAISIEKEYRKNSLCLDDEWLNKEKRFTFICCFYTADDFTRRMCYDIKQFCYFDFTGRGRYPNSFELKNGYIIGSIIDYIRFRSLIKKNEPFYRTKY